MKPMTAPGVRDILAHQAVSAADMARRRSWVVYVARAGYAARGSVYLLVGGLSLLSVFGRGGETGDQKDALRTVLAAPGGWMILAALAAGLLCFAVWRAIQIVVGQDDRHDDSKSKQVFRRIGQGISAVVHVCLALAAIKLAWGYGSGSDNAAQDWTGWLLQKPFGRVLVFGVAAGIFGGAVAQAIKAWKASFEKQLRIDRDKLEKLRPICRIGLFARAVCFALIASFLVYAAWTYDPSQAGGLREVFQESRKHGLGSAGVAVLSAGLFAFGVYGIVQAIWRRVP
jgi:hypothetical protein